MAAMGLLVREIWSEKDWIVNFLNLFISYAALFFRGHGPLP